MAFRFHSFLMAKMGPPYTRLTTKRGNFTSHALSQYNHIPHYYKSVIQVETQEDANLVSHT